GRVLFSGEDVTYMPAHLRSVGLVFQNYALFPHMSVFDNVAFPLRMRKAGTQQAREHVLAALELVHMAGHEDRLPAQLSGGQQQRVALARALVFRPSLLLMDEPLGALDRNLREHMQLEIKAVQRATGVTIVYVTHDQQEALVLSDRIAIMERGRIRMVGPAEEVYERPVDAFVAQFIGETNLLRGPVVAGHAGGRAVRLGRDLDIPLGPRGEEVPPGREVVFCLRPERIRCPADGASDSISCAARVADITYQGDTVKYRVILEGSTPEVALVGKQMAGDRTGALRVGDRTTVGWRMEDAWQLPNV
ncbi:MAG: ABC transporter ATP-binding protein, partial [Gemmatimonadetes bacterium]|nr:ABC transporter ATP-binding protein [Gemmatimonadota bacterium]